ncbi:MAG: hypothetical protein ACKPA9_02115, partial [Microcystis sp.]
MTFLCDTNIISELARPQSNAGVLQWSREVSSIALSVITLEEIYYGLTSKPNARINTWFQQFFITVKLYQLRLFVTLYAKST